MRTKFNIYIFIVFILPHKREQMYNFWIRELGMITLYGCNDIIIDIFYRAFSVAQRIWWTLSAPLVNVRSHGHRHYASSILHAVSLYDLPFIQKPIKTYFLVQLMFGKLRYRTKFKSLVLPSHIFQTCCR